MATLQYIRLGGFHYFKYKYLYRSKLCVVWIFKDFYVIPVICRWNRVDILRDMGKINVTIIAFWYGKVNPLKR